MGRDTIPETEAYVAWAEDDFNPNSKPCIDPRSFEGHSKLQFWRGILKNPKKTVLIEAAMVDAFRAGVTAKPKVISLVQERYPDYTYDEIKKRYVPNMIRLLARLFNVALGLGARQIADYNSNSSKPMKKRKGNRNAIFPKNNSGEIGAKRESLFRSQVHSLLGNLVEIEDVSATSCHYDVLIRSVR